MGFIHDHILSIILFTPLAGLLVLVFVPGENKCMCLFEAPNPENVRDANVRANVPFTKIVPAMDLTP